MKMMKRLSVIALSFVLVLTGIARVGAYDGNYTISKYIELNFMEDKNDENFGQYITLSGTLKSDDAKVYSQEIGITKEVYDSIAAKSKEYKEYADAQLEKINNETDETTKEALETELVTKTNEYETWLKSVIPNFDDTKWIENELIKKLDNEYRYAASATFKNAYFVTWVKVSINGVDYYQFSENCLTDTPEIKCDIINGVYFNDEGEVVSKEEYEKACSKEEKKVCRIEDGKYYDDKGNEVSKDEYYEACPNPKTGSNIYYTYGVITLAAAFVLYLLTRKVKKFSK